MEYVQLVAVFIIILLAASIVNYEQPHKDFLVYLFAILRNGTQLTCFGTHIEKHYILTAAHCVNDTDIVGIKFIGEQELYDNALEIKATENDIIVHENFKNEAFLVNDIALIKLNTTTIKAINSEKKYMNTTKLFDKQDKNYLKYFNVLGRISNTFSTLFRVVTKKTCPFDDRSDVICTDLGDLTKGDSGAPLMYREEQIGIVSSGDDKTRIMIYMFLPYYKSWIKERKNLCNPNNKNNKNNIPITIERIIIIILVFIIVVLLCLLYRPYKKTSKNKTTANNTSSNNATKSETSDNMASNEKPPYIKESNSEESKQQSKLLKKEESTL